MTAGLVVDIILVVALVVAIIAGFRRGFLHTVGALVGLVAGGFAALLLMPIVAAFVPAPGWNVLVALLVGVFIVGLGVSIGSWIGRLLRRPVRKLKLGPLDRLLGAIANGIVALLVMLLLATSTSALGFPVLTQAVASSTVLRTLETITPGPVESGIARFRALVIVDGIPTVLGAAGLPDQAKIPDADTNTPALQQAAQSVTRITANSPMCGTRSSGSGFVIGDDLVMTNAHVVAGATDAVVEASGELPRAASVVYFDPDADIAVLSVSGLDAAALPFGPNPEANSTAFFQGFPYGGPFVSRSASVLGIDDIQVQDIYNEKDVTRSVTSLAAHVEPGNSGGPLLTPDGAVAGMIFARAEGTSDVGFALSMNELSPVIAQAESFTAPVASGACAAH